MSTMDPSKKLQSDSWKKIVRSGNRVFIGSNAACPHALINHFLERMEGVRDLEFVHILTQGPNPWVSEKYQPLIKTNSLFLSGATREAVQQGKADYTPCFLSEIPGLFLDRVLPLDVALIQVSPPDAHGYCSFGVSVDVVSAACRAAKVVVAQINPLMPRTMGQSFIHVNQIAFFLEAEAPIPEIPVPKLDDVTLRIGQYVAQLIDDGSTLQMGIGKIPDAVLRYLTEHNDLGIHTEMLSDGILGCLEQGVINNRKKTIHAGKTITSFCMGTRKLYDYVNENPHVHFYPSEYVNSPLTIARHDKMVAINSALQVDLTGQVVSDSIGYRCYSGIGGQVDFIRGAAMSRGGRPIIALPSTAKEGKISRIVPFLNEGAGVVTSRGDVHYVVTEYGIATLRGRSIRERVLELIQIAHPDFREELLKHAKKHFLVPVYQKGRPEEIAELGEVDLIKLDLKEEEFFLKPLHPSDERRLQEFFYSHTQETLLQRYGQPMMSMTRERAYELVNVNQKKDLALCILKRQGPREIIHAVGRYVLDEKKKSAEIAFVVRESQREKGMASVLVRRLMDVAKKRKLSKLYCRVQFDNLPMLHILEKFGFAKEPAEDRQEFDLELQL
ncbi:MAG: GNAT family N-acetyltransferase [bacterium]|nr:GNAT family N-acetyltransferase [bacterium]